MTEKALNVVEKASRNEIISACSICPARDNSVLRNSSESILDIISSSRKKMFFAKGELLAQEDDSSQKIYCISTGKIKIYKTDSNGNEVIIRFATAGDIIGGEMLMSKSIYDISAMAVADSFACCIDSEVYRNAIKSEGELPMELLKYYEGELHRAKIKILKLARLKVNEKVADALLTLYETFRMNDDNSTIRITLSRQDIANMAGTTKEQVSKVLSKFSDQGIIKARGKQIEFLNLETLRKISHV